MWTLQRPFNYVGQVCVLVGLCLGNSESWSMASPWQDKTEQAGPDDWNREWFVDRAEQDEFMRGLKLAAVENPELHGSVAMINDLMTGQPLGATGQRFGLVSNGIGVLANESFRAELDISDSQYRELQTLQENWTARVRKDLKSADRSDMAAILQSISSSQSEVESSLRTVLLPHQQRRLEQALWEQQLRRKTLATLLSENPLKETLQVTDQQAQDLQEFETKLNDELAKEIARLEYSARLKLLKRLNPTQQSQAEEILGPALEELSQQPFEPKPDSKRISPKKNPTPSKKD
ncbi:MAG: hypothetical protein JNK57_12235 [Planctomycetaceae bacterium]|nr:hypothetical protein [Planctomycetaceae bacterium]